MQNSLLQALRNLAVCLLLATSARAADPVKKLPVPLPAAQAEAAKLIKDIYAAEYAKAESSVAKRTLGRTLFEKAKTISVSSDATGKFVLLKTSRDIATQALDGMTAFQAIDLMAESYEIDPVEMKASVLQKGSAAAKSQRHHAAILDQAIKLIDRAVAEDNYTCARQLCELCITEGRAANEEDEATKAIALSIEIDKFAQLYATAQNAVARLKANPVDPQANAAMGSYLGFVKADWDDALLMLALGTDLNLKAIALREFDELTPAQQADLGDTWRAMAEKQAGSTRRHILVRAAHWYRKAVPGLTGLNKEKAVKDLLRIEGPK